VVATIALTASLGTGLFESFKPLFGRLGAANEWVMREVNDKSAKKEVERMDFIVMIGARRIKLQKLLGMEEEE
jgi:hypothetical protein